MAAIRSWRRDASDRRSASSRHCPRISLRPVPGTASTILVLGARTGLATGFPRRVIRDGVEIVVDDIPASERF